MKRAVVIALLACWAASALSLAESMPSATVSSAKEFSPSEPPSSNTTTTASPTTNTTTKPTTNTTTINPNTTTTTINPNTTTTTIKPNTTTTTANSTTTTKPTTTTSPKPTTTPSPPQPNPVGNYTVMSGKVVCLRAQMALQIRMEPQTSGPFIVQPNMTSAGGGCNMSTANLTLGFKEGYITFMFNKSTDDNTVYVYALSFVISYPLSKESKIPYTANNKSMHLFPAKIGHSYSCRAESLYMGNGLYLDINQDRMQAFNLTSSQDFGSSDPCAADQPDYRVAIAVGVTLLVLIIIVVVAYLLGRRRRTDGYQSL